MSLLRSLIHHCLPGIRGATAIGLLVTDIRIFILVTKLETQIVDNIADILDNVSALGQVALNSLAT